MLLKLLQERKDKKMQQIATAINKLKAAEVLCAHAVLLN